MIWLIWLTKKTKGKNKMELIKQKLKTKKYQYLNRVIVHHEKKNTESEE